MGQLYLVRHGQASFGADNYDQLSPLGERQSLRLGEYWRSRGMAFEASFSGTLQRHAQTLAGICQGLGTTPTNTALPGLNEYDAEALVAAIHPLPLEKADTPEKYRAHFRLLRDAIRAWMDGTTSPRGMPTYDAFVQGVVDTLQQVRSRYQGNVLLVSSGGPISTAVGQILGTTPETTIELNLRIRNSAVSEFSFTPKRHSLLSFNNLPHLDGPEYKDWISYA